MATQVITLCGHQDQQSSFDLYLNHCLYLIWDALNSRTLMHLGNILITIATSLEIRNKIKLNKPIGLHQAQDNLR
jgi:hypothetical protein